MDLISKIQTLASGIAGDVIKMRHHLHANPELSFEEFETSKYVYDKLKDIGLNVEKGIADTGVVAMVYGKDPDSRVIALRADMDALPIQEENEIPYRSKKDGVMHACGHDVHTSSLLGTAIILNEMRNNFKGSIKLIFQPGEEKIPGGASLMIKDGVLNNPAPQNIIGQHVMAQIPVGKAGFRSGMYMASSDEIYLTVKGKGGHGAMPENNIDPVLIASHIIVSLQQVISRNADPKIPSVLSFGKVIADGATNVIPNDVKIEGTFRTLNENWRREAHQRIKSIAESIAKGMGGKCEVNILNGYPYLENNIELTDHAKACAIDYLGEENVVDLDIWMAAEDFAYFSQKIDACFYRLGVGNVSKGITSTVHTPTFNIDEDALKTGSGLMAWIAIQTLLKDI
ncbi:M20 family metallopeptidase [Bacteroidota bacterium]